jgi:phospholipid transport system substrate-binding protein
MMISAGFHRTLLSAFLLVLPTLTLTAPAAEAREKPVQFMQRAANELVRAARSGSARDFADVLSKYADKPSIGLYSLGSYAKSLSRGDRKPYYSGMIGFLARYAASQAPKYRVRSVRMVSQTRETRSGVYVDSVVALTDGTTYDVRWWLIRRGGTYRVGDVSVLGFWGREQLKRLFEGYINDNGGNPKALIVALNR